MRARKPIAATIAGVTNGTANNALTNRTCFHSPRAKCQAIGSPINTVASAETDASTIVKYIASMLAGLSANVEMALITDSPVTICNLSIAKNSGANEIIANAITAESEIIILK